MNEPIDRSIPLVRPTSYSIADNLWASMRFAWAGIYYTFVTQRNFRIQSVIGLVAMGLSAYVELAPMQFLLVCMATVAVLALELLNTAIEAVVDLTIGKTYHIQAKIAKDCSAGAVLLAAIGSLVVAIILLLPALWEKIGKQIPLAQ